MTISGSMATMSLPEILEWAENGRKTGVLHLSRGRSTISFVSEQGAIRGCATDEPPMLLGQFLLSHGKIDEAALHAALAEQESSGEPIGAIFERQGILQPGELARYVNAKAEETILSLFAWQDAHFEFVSGGASPPNTIAIEIQINELLLRGAQRQDEVDRIKSVFPDRGIVLRKTSQKLNAETAATPMARRVYELIDGRHTIEEILLQSRASEMLALSFLYQLYRRGIVAVGSVRETAPARGTPEAISRLALELMEKKDLEAALDTLNDGLTRYPRNDVLRRVMARVEATYLQQVFDELPPTALPVARRSRASIDDGEPLSADELFLLELVEEARWDVRSLAKIAPLHEIDVIRGLRGLKRKGLIELRTVEESPEAEPELQLGDPTSLLGKTR